MVTVDADSDVAGPIVVVHEFSDFDRPTACTTRTVVTLGAGSSAVVVEHLVSGAGELLVLPVIELDVTPLATLVYHVVQELGAESWSFAYQASEVAESGMFRSFARGAGRWLRPPPHQVDLHRRAGVE